ncbi:hypothetical protein DY037_07145 [Apilactobacillus micheneri]|uniref:hypothetical protein n=1 Tax=Apilactobacillus micheneri TaxID=1899430 RepID=UPI001127228F|nr:hypothetical protein [Apilactobacillus micheneri]TPR48160.1 hypothetical protein DY037_07145 [Apilactobacillus micheneri]
MAGLDSLKGKEFKHSKPDTSKPETIKPKKSETPHRTMPDDQILVHYKGRLTSKYTPKSVQMQSDSHMALKQISISENKPMREVVNEVIENYIKDMPDTQKKLILPQIRAIQMSMPEDNL